MWPTSSLPSPTPTSPSSPLPPSARVGNPSATITEGPPQVPAGSLPWPSQHHQPVSPPTTTPAPALSPQPPPLLPGPASLESLILMHARCLDQMLQNLPMVILGSSSSGSTATTKRGREGEGQGEEPSIAPPTPMSSEDLEMVARVVQGLSSLVGGGRVAIKREGGGGGGGGGPVINGAQDEGGDGEAASGAQAASFKRPRLSSSASSLSSSPSSFIKLSPSSSREAESSSNSNSRHHRVAAGDGALKKEPGEEDEAVGVWTMTSPLCQQESATDGLGALPDPLWQHVFGMLAARDLFPVMVTSRHFRFLTRSLDAYYRHWNLRAAETVRSPGPYIDRQKHLNAKMRAILLDWLTDVHQSLGFQPATFYRTAHILDHFLLRTENVSREKLQLVGVTAFMVSAKVMEKNAPEPDDCAYWTDNAYSGTEVSAMEQRVVKVYRAVAATGPAPHDGPLPCPNPNHLLAPTAWDFLQLYLKEAKLGKLASCRAQYYCERVVQEHCMLSYPPSMLAAAALLLAYKAGTPSGPAWPVELQKFSGYKATDLGPCATEMCKHVAETVTTLSGRRLDAVKRKYQTGVFLAVSKMEAPTHTAAGQQQPAAASTGTAVAAGGGGGGGGGEANHD